MIVDWISNLGTISDYRIRLTCSRLTTIWWKLIYYANIVESIPSKTDVTDSSTQEYISYWVGLSYWTWLNFMHWGMPVLLIEMVVSWMSDTVHRLALLCVMGLSFQRMGEFLIKLWLCLDCCYWREARSWV